jgi:hypothetical protein
MALNPEIDCEEELDDTDIGRMHLFWIMDSPDDHSFSFSSTLENIPIRESHDCSLKNKTKVLVLSDPTEAWHPWTGPILVTRILADKAMWVATVALHLIER